MNSKIMPAARILLPITLLVSFIPLVVYSNQKGDHDSIQQWTQKRQNMVKVLKRYRIKDKRVLSAMNKVQRHLYIPEPFRLRYNPYGDHPCPIGYGQTISQPYIVAYMTEKLNLTAGEKVLEVGTGSGYQAAILAELGVKVYSIEVVGQLAEHARTVLTSEGYKSVKIRHGDGYQGWAEFAPYDAIIGTCAPKNIPTALKDQLKEGGRMILPVGSTWQRLIIVRKRGGTFQIEKDLNVRFVPMVKRRKQSPANEPF